MKTLTKMARYSFSRNSNKKLLEQNKVFLIVTEGTQTEPLYFDALRKDFRIPTLLVVVSPAKHSDPLHVVKEAILMLKGGYFDQYGRKYNKEDFDAVYVVMDIDSHENMSQAMAVIENFNRNTRNKIKIHPIRSNPCFELWYLLHFEEVFPCNKNQNEVIGILNKYVKSGYKKSENIYTQIKDNMEIAFSRSEKLRKLSHDAGDVFTEVDILVKDIIANFVKKNSN